MNILERLSQPSHFLRPISSSSSSCLERQSLDSDCLQGAVWYSGRKAQNLESKHLCLSSATTDSLTVSVCYIASEGLSFFSCKIGLLIADLPVLGPSVTSVIPDQLWMFEALCSGYLFPQSQINSGQGNANYDQMLNLRIHKTVAIRTLLFFNENKYLERIVT